MSGSGFLLYDKPAGITSFSSLAGFKKLKPAMKFGHAGTLDRFATGLLIVMAGNYSHLAPWFLGLDKAYKAEICFGTETDTLDPEGSIIRSGIIPSKDELENCLPGFIGEQYQVPPDYSALHVKGTRASDLARKGCHPDLAARKISIFRLEMLSCQSPCAILNIECSSGTYIRALARDIAATCGTCAHVRNLRRTRVGPFSVEDALTHSLPTAETGSLPPL
ncbi:MAG: tRNA pseudouridine(55) synthase TruB, partial [Spirochaetaceae bacterium]|nr:tRNA pseudouridine(55) synthase TruB [Spirochaetaceae bacterium]